MEAIFRTLKKNYIRYGKKSIIVIIDVDDNIWFRANDVAEALEYKSAKPALRRHVEMQDIISLRDIESEQKIKLKGMHSQTVFINEGGLYDLMIGSQLPKAKEFKRWITHEILPSIRKYGKYIQKEEYGKKYSEIMKKINKLEKENLRMQQDLKKEKYPTGGVVYVIDYSDDDKEVYRIGMTQNMNRRKKSYDTHTLHKQNVVLIQKTNNPIRLETCIRSMLYEKRYKNRKDFYICSLQEIKNAFKVCVKNLNKTDQKGGYAQDILEKLRLQKDWLEKKIDKLDKDIHNNKCQIMITRIN